MKKITLTLNWIAILLIVIVPVVNIILALNTIHQEIPLGGADGPTAIFISTDIDPFQNIIPLLIFLVLLMNIYVIRKQEKQIANQNMEPIVTTPVDKVEPQSTQAHV
jgi:hypothetical protein